MCIYYGHLTLSQYQADGVIYSTQSISLPQMPPKSGFTNNDISLKVYKKWKLRENQANAISLVIYQVLGYYY